MILKYIGLSPKTNIFGDWVHNQERIFIDKQEQTIAKQLSRLDDWEIVTKEFIIKPINIQQSIDKKVKKRKTKETDLKDKFDRDNTEIIYDTVDKRINKRSDKNTKLINKQER